MAEPAYLGGLGVDSLLEDTRRALEQMRPAAGAAAEQATEGRGTGEAAEGQVRATAMVGGRLESLQVDPRAMRLGSQALGEQIVIAVNAALDDLREQVGDTPVPGAADPAALAEQMRDLQQRSAHQMEMLSQGVTAAMARIRESTGR